MSIQESGEMYLETILFLTKKNNVVRAIDIAEHMRYSKAAVSRALSKLREDKLILTDRDGYIDLTENGRIFADKVYRKHALLTEFFMHIGVDAETAESDACRIEHVLSDKTFEAIIEHAKGKTK